MKRYALPLAVLLALTGCSGGEPNTPPPGYENDIEGGQEALDAEASANADENATLVEAGETAEWDNGVTAKITAVTAEPVEGSDYADKGHDTMVHVVVEIANTGADTFMFGDEFAGPKDDLYYGENLYEAQEWALYDNQGQSVDDLPKQLVPGSSATYASDWSLAGEGLSMLTFEFTPARDDLPPFTFAGVETLIA